MNEEFLDSFHDLLNKPSYLGWELAHLHMSHPGISLRVSPYTALPNGQRSHLPSRHMASNPLTEKLVLISGTAPSPQWTRPVLIWFTFITRFAKDKVRTHMKSVGEKPARDKSRVTKISKASWGTLKAKHLSYFCKLKHKVKHKYLGMPELDQKISLQLGKQTEQYQIYLS